MTRKNKTLMSVQHSARIGALHQYSHMKITDIQKLFPQYSRATIYRHAKADVNAEKPLRNVTKKIGRPRKVSVADKESIKNTISELRDSECSFTSPRVGVKAGVSRKFSNRTLRRAMHELGYGYYNTRRKGVMKSPDFPQRVKFCDKIKYI